MGSSSNFDQQRNRTASRNSLSYYWQLPMPTLPLRLRLRQRLIPHSFTPHITDILTPTDTDITDIPMPIPMDIMPLLALFIPYMVDIHTVIMLTQLALSMQSQAERGARLRPRLILRLGITDIMVTLIDTDTTVDTMDLDMDTLDTTDIPMVMDITDGADREIQFYKTFQMRYHNLENS